MPATAALIQAQREAVVALNTYAVEESEALAYAVVLHALNLIPYIVVGYFLVHGHIRRGLTEPATSAGERTASV